MKRYLLLIITILLVSCYKQNSNIDSEVEIVEINISNFNYELISDIRFFDPSSNFTLTGRIKEIHFMTRAVQEEDSPELSSSIFYYQNGLMKRNIVYSYGDAFGEEMSYDEHGRLIKIQSIVEGSLVNQDIITYSYKDDEITDDLIVRNEVKDDEIYSTQTILLESDRIKIITRYHVKKQNVTYSLQFVDGVPTIHIRKYENRQWKTEFHYEGDYLDNMIEYTSADSKMFVHEFLYNNDNQLTQVTTFDHRQSPPVKGRIKKYSNYDENGNWLDEEIYDNDILVGKNHREIVYWD